MELDERPLNRPLTVSGASNLGGAGIAANEPPAFLAYEGAREQLAAKPTKFQQLEAVLLNHLYERQFNPDLTGSICEGTE
jgi:hypothetical protein